MRIADLRILLKEKNVNENAYSLNDTEFPNEAYVIRFNGLMWEVYYSERGKKVSLKRFFKESMACDYFLKIAKDLFDIL